MATLYDDHLAKQSDATVGGDAVPPSTEYFGFALYLGSSITFLIYILWAYLPLCDWLGLCYYPSRWWALAVPAYLVVTLIYIYVALACYNTEILTAPVRELSTVTDPAAHVVSGGASGQAATRARAKRSQGGKRRRRKLAPTDLSPLRSVLGSPVSSSTNLAGMATEHFDTAYYLFNPSDGVWDLPLSQVCSVLYESRKPDE